MTGSTHQVGHQRQPAVESPPAPYAAPHRASVVTGPTMQSGVPHGEKQVWPTALRPYAPAFRNRSLAATPRGIVVTPGVAVVPETADGPPSPALSVGVATVTGAGSDAGSDAGASGQALPWIEAFAPDGSATPWIEAFAPDGRAPLEPDGIRVQATAADASVSNVARADRPDDEGFAQDASTVTADATHAHRHAVGQRAHETAQAAAMLPDASDPTSEAGDSWPMDEIGARLHELAQTLPLLDDPELRSVAGVRAAATGADTAVGPSVLPMWNDDEWGDILAAPRTLEAAPSLSGELEAAQAGRDVLPGADAHDAHDTSHLAKTQRQTDAGATHAGGSAAGGPAGDPAFPLEAVELTARALEGLAERVRAGGVAVPAFQPGTAEPAMLAGVLAALLGWRQ